MDTPLIREHIKKTETVAGLVKVLNHIKRDEFGELKYGITEKMLRYFSSDAIATKRYRTFHIRKKSGGLRQIKAPCRQLDLILTLVNIMLQAVYEPSDVAMGFTPGRSVKDNAQLHVGHNYVFNIDLKDFFPSIPQPRVWKRLQLSPFNFTQEVANVLAGLCCTYDDEAKVNVLPQGSPASPLLTNAICDKLDRRMKGVAKRFGLHYTRYADDMTFSSMHNVYQEGSAFRSEIRRIIEEQGFRMNDKKTRLQKKGSRQEVTGLTVNVFPNVSRQYISDLRWLLHVWETEGYAKAYAIFYPKYKAEKGYIKKGEPVMENVIGGKLNYLRMVKGDNNPAYKKLAARYDALQELTFIDTDTDNTQSYVYVQPYMLTDFQSLFHTTISLEISKRGKLVGKCQLYGRDKVIAVSKSTQKALCPDLTDESVEKAMKSKEFKNCYVTLCRSKGKNFWLISKSVLHRSHCLSIQNLKVNPDELLSLWEKYGYEDAAGELEMFIRYGRQGESILDWNPLKEKKGEDANIDRGGVKQGNNYLLKFLLGKKSLTHSQMERLIRLLIPSLPDGPVDTRVVELLEIWENQGINAAVKAWKKLIAEQNSSKDKRSKDFSVQAEKNERAYSKDVEEASVKNSSTMIQDSEDVELFSSIDSFQPSDDDIVIATF